ncbi:TIGR02584 family CRISPR-associated protein [Allofranklinella schreckenbergeri]|uniref:TIGR02584 family CRISPR-associated protein n=1 Tax=Allofranklinella schreckenbergeri TaxID=1076744 RepID=A0A3M6QFT9_9BURK|nr:TIGR02584 family CRISPR-associated protein [Allofranklinella schreckenbergeri]
MFQRNQHKHVLLATTGSSPQVVTETLYAIAHERRAWPDEICLITTRLGKTKAQQGLIEQGHLQRLCRQLQRPLPAFDESHILVVPNALGEPVEDARSLADHEALADFIMTEVRNRTAQPHCCLHASLAGGRKTMTFYMGYAMSLFGRAQDSLSHVLVSEGYENIPDFWFPTDAPAHRHIHAANGHTLDASAARVTLAPIPFIRHRHNLPEVLLQASAPEPEPVRFAQLVQLINLGENPQDLQLTVDMRQRCIHLESAAPALHLAFSPSAIDLAFFCLMARASIAHENDITRPASGKADPSLAKLMLDELMPLCGLPSCGDWRKDLDALSNWNITRAAFKDASLSTLQKGVSQSWFDTRKNTLGQLFAQRLPAKLAQWLAPAIVWSETGQRLDWRLQDTTPKRGGYGLPLPAAQLRIVEALP